MKVLALLGSSGACGFYRLFIPFHELNKRGHLCLASNIVFDDLFDHLKFEPDFIYCQRADNPKLLHTMHIIWKKPWVFDIDDDYYHIPKNSPAAGLVSAIPRLKVFIGNSSISTVSTKPLSELYSSFGSKLRVVPNSVPDNWFDLKLTSNKSNIPIIGWAGSATHSGDLEVVKKALRKLRKKREFKLLFFGWIPDWAKKEFECMFVRPVPVEKYMEVLVSLPITVAIAPLADNKFNESKSAIKVYEYGVCKIPTIVSNVGPYKEPPNSVVVRVNNDDKEWFEALDLLLKDPNLRTSYGNKLRDWTKEKHVISKEVETWERAFGEVNLP